MDRIIDMAIKEFNLYTNGRMNPGGILSLSLYRNTNRAIREAEVKLANPVHYRTGKSLSPVTVRDCKLSLRREKRRRNALKIAIQMMVVHGILGDCKETTDPPISFSKKAL